jgi:hypothetical protein
MILVQDVTRISPNLAREFNKNYINGDCQGQPDGVSSDVDEITHTCGDGNN